MNAGSIVAPQNHPGANFSYKQGQMNSIAPTTASLTPSLHPSIAPQHPGAFQRGSLGPNQPLLPQNQEFQVRSQFIQNAENVAPNQSAMKNYPQSNAKINAVAQNQFAPLTQSQRINQVPVQTQLPVQGPYPQQFNNSQAPQPQLVTRQSHMSHQVPLHVRPSLAQRDLIQQQMMQQGFPPHPQFQQHPGMQVQGQFAP